MANWFGLSDFTWVMIGLVADLALITLLLISAYVSYKDISSRKRYLERLKGVTEILHMTNDWLDERDEETFVESQPRGIYLYQWYWNTINSYNEHTQRGRTIVAQYLNDNRG